MKCTMIVPEARLAKALMELNAAVRAQYGQGNYVIAADKVHCVCYGTDDDGMKRIMPPSAGAIEAPKPKIVMPTHIGLPRYLIPA